MILSYEERKEIEKWLEDHLDYSRSKKTGKYFWETFPDHKLFGMYSDYLAKHRAMIQAYMNYQYAEGKIVYEAKDLENIRFNRLRTMCVQKGLLKPVKQKVTSVEVVPEEKATKAKKAGKKVLSVYVDGAKDKQEEIFQYAFEFSNAEDDLKLVVPPLSHLLDKSDFSKYVNSLGEKEPLYDKKVNELKILLINFMMNMMGYPGYKGKKYKREELYQISLNQLMVMYDNLRDEMSTYMYEEERKRRFGK